VDEAALAQRAGEHGLGGVAQPAGAVADHQQRRLEATLGQLDEEIIPGVGGLAAAWGERDQHRVALGGDGQAASTGSARARRAS
jgi:hypothetical protein